MKELLNLMAEAIKQSNADKYWLFYFDGQNKKLDLKFHEKGRKTPWLGTFFADPNGLTAACKFISDNLNK